MYRRILLLNVMINHLQGNPEHRWTNDFYTTLFAFVLRGAAILRPRRRASHVKLYYVGRVVKAAAAKVNNTYGDGPLSRAYTAVKKINKIKIVTIIITMINVDDVSAALSPNTGVRASERIRNSFRMRIIKLTCWTVTALRNRYNIFIASSLLSLK